MKGIVQTIGLGNPRYQKINRESRLDKIPILSVLFLFTAMTALGGGSIYWILKKDNEIEKFRRVELELQNQIKERDMQIQQNRQHIEQLERRVEIIDAIKELSYGNLPEKEVRTIAKEVEDMGQKFGHDPLLLVAVIYTESSIRPHVKSHVGAHGLMQLMPDTGKELTKQVTEMPKVLGYTESEEMEVPTYREIEGNIQLGTLYLTKLMMRYKNLEDAICAYNLGPSLFEKRKKEGGSMPVKYVSKILTTYNFLLEQRNQKELPLPTLFDTKIPHNLVARIDYPPKK